MAISLETLRNQIMTSIHGRRLGLDPNQFLLGPKELRVAVTANTSATTGTTIPNYGIHTVVTTTNDTWTLEAPQPGTRVSIGTASTSTGTHTITPTGATIVSSNGVASGSIALAALGDYIELLGLSTSQWMVGARYGSVTLTS